MADIAELVRRLGGMAQKQQLVRRGARDGDLTRAVRSGEVTRVRNGWYSTLPASDPRLRAVRVGGRLTGISAVVAQGGWAFAQPLLHVAVAPNASRLRGQWNRHSRHRVDAPRGVALHWESVELAERGTTMIAGIADVLTRVILDESFEDAIAALDWALHTGAIDRFDFEAMILTLPEHLRRIGEWVDAQCESFPESLARTRSRLAGHSVLSQVHVGDDDERIDLLIDGCVGLEVDGERWHINRFEEDRRKDITMTIENIHAIRPAAVHVFGDWDRVARAIEVALHARGLPACGNSGVSGASMRMIDAMSGPRGRRCRSTPEFTTGAASGRAGDASTGRE